MLLVVCIQKSRIQCDTFYEGHVYNQNISHQSIKNRSKR